MANVNVSPEGLIPELGDIWTFISTVHKQTFGKIIYRDGSSIRIQQYNGSTAPVEFTLDPTTGFFLEQLGVSDIICHEKRKEPHFSRQLGVIEGEALELYTIDGQPIDSDKTHTVVRIIAEEDADAIVLEDGTTLDFAFIGPPEGIGLITVAPAEDAEAENNSASGLTADVEAEPVEAFPAFDESLLPAALVEEIPTEERMYSDTIQRTDMFTSLYINVPTRKQKDPKTMAYLYRVTDLLLALKNSVVVRDDNLAIVLGEQETYIADTIEDSLAMQPTSAPLASLLPIAAVKRVIYTDDVNEALADKGDIESRSDIKSLVGALQATSVYNTAEAAGNPFISYINALMKTVEVYKASGSGSAKIRMDQDVYRTVLPGEPLTGLKHTPAARDPRTGESLPLLADRHLTAVKDRAVRLLSASRIRNPVTGTTFIVAPADSGETVGHVVLDNNLTKYRAPTRSSVLLWDIQASEVSRKMVTLFGTALNANFEEQVVLTEDDDAETDLAEQLDIRLQPALNFISRHNTSVMDGLGLRNLEINNDQFVHLVASVESGTKAWSAAFVALGKAAGARESTETMPAIKGVAADDSPLMSDATLDDETLKPVADELSEKHSGSVLEKYDLAYANDLVSYANSTLGPYYFGLAGAAEAPYLEKTQADYKNEAGRILRNKTTARSLAIDFSAEPELIICPHVEYLEKVYGIQEDGKRLLMLDKVVKIFNGGQEGNYINCGTCGNHLICKHELLLVNEFLHPGRGVALHKALLLEFGNGVFEGAYICKNCGQRISDIEYDTHLEFDDEGRPLVGRSVVDQTTDEDVVIADETDAAIPFEDKTDKAIYKLTRSMFERIGLHATEEMYKRVVPAARQYLEKHVPTEKKYNKEREKALAAKKPMVEYKHYLADMQTGIISALVLIEFQTSSIMIPLPLPGAVFSREGFPADGDDFKVVGMAALDYVTFGLAGLFLNSAPWNITTWAPVARDKDRIKMAKNAIANGVFAILALPTPSVPAPNAIGAWTDKYKKRLATWREKKRETTTGTTAVTAASLSDRLPPVFRPLNRSIPPPAAPAIGNRAAFIDQVAKGDFATVASAVTKRSHVLAQQIINDFHRVAAASAIVVASSQRSDSTCCYTRLGEAAKVGLGAKALGLEEARAAELELHGRAERMLKERDPAASAAGTHIYSEWFAPYNQTVLPVPKEEDYYKLFLKNCFSGDNMGLPHEYNPNNTCRHCGFDCPEMFLYPRGAEIPLDASSKKRTEMMNALNTAYETAAREALAESVTINEERFSALEARVRERRIVPSVAPPATMPFLERLADLETGMDTALLPAALAEWTGAIEILASLDEENIVKEDERRGLLAPFAAQYDEQLKALRAVLNTSASDRERGFVDQAIEALGKITENAVGAVNARNISALFVVHGEQIADNYNNKDPNPSKWFPKLSYSHNQLVIRIWNTIAEITTKRLESLKGLDGTIVSVIQTALRRFTKWLGRSMIIWINEFRPGHFASDKELTLLLRWTVVCGLVSLMTAGSPLYAGATSPASRRTATKFFASWILDALIKAKQRVETYQLTAEQIQEKLNERAETERAYFLNKFDELSLDDRKVELIKKKLKIGDWAIDTRKQFSLDPETMERDREQLMAMGIINAGYDEHITGVPLEGGRERGGEVYGFLGAGPEEGVNMHNNLFADPNADDIE